MPILTSKERIGTRIEGRYKLESVLAQGGMSTLFLGLDERLNRRVAVKLLKTRYTEDASEAARLLTEAQTISKLRHPNVVEIFDVGEVEEGVPYLVMELLEGHSLADEIASCGRLSPEQTLSILAPVMGALAIAHDAAIVHRDLKPSNIFLCKVADSLLHPKLLDFGIAKVEGSDQETKTGMVLGTPDYMSPEQAAGDEIIPSVDVWAMGVLLYQCLSGSLPFEAPTPMKVLMKVVNEPAPRLHELAPQVGERLCVAVDRALHTDLSVRYPDMREFAKALLSTAQAEGIAIPDEPDPIGLPDWPKWSSGDLPDDYITMVVEPVQARADQGRNESKGWTPIQTAAAKKFSEFVDRKKEIKQIEKAFALTRDGSGQMVGIAGEAGIGKSRLLLESVNLFPPDDYNYLEGRCLQHGGSISYLPILGLLRSYFQIKKGDAESSIRRKLRDKLDDSLEDARSPLEELFSLETDEKEIGSLDPEEKKERIFTAISDLFMKISAEKSLIIAIDNLHWIDDISNEFIDFFMDSLKSTHILLILLYRPECTLQWTDSANYTEINLERFDTGLSAALLESLLPNGEIEPVLGKLIRNRAGGNPLFTEELTHTLLENGSIQKKDNRFVLNTEADSISVPGDVQEIIATRMDQLEESLKRTMQMASVIGSDFGPTLLQAITGMQEELKSHLTNLGAMELIYSKSSSKDPEFVFKHDLTREAAYNSIEADKKKEIHNKTAIAIEQSYPERLKDFFETLAYHFSNAENWQKAYKYLALSGEKARISSLNEEAYRFYIQALQALEYLPDTDEYQKPEVEIRFSLAGIQILMDYPTGSKENFERMEKIANELGDARSIALASVIWQTYHGNTGSPELSKKYAELGLEKALEVQDVEIMTAVAASLCGSYAISGEYAKLIEYAPRVIKSLEKEEKKTDLWNAAVNLYSFLCTFCGAVKALLGDPNEGKLYCEKAILNATEIGHLPSLGMSEAGMAALGAIIGDGLLTIEHAQKSIEHFEQAGWSWIVSLSLALKGAGYYFVDDLETAKEILEKVYSMRGDSIASMWTNLPYFYLSMVHCDLGNLDKAKTHADEALEVAKQTDDKIGSALALSQIGRVLGKLDPLQCIKAEEYILKAVEIYKTLGVQSLGSLVPVYLGELYLDTGDKQKISENLEYFNQTEKQMKEMGMDYWAKRARELLAKMESMFT